MASITALYFNNKVIELSQNPDTVYFSLQGKESLIDDFPKFDKLFNQVLTTTHLGLSFLTKISKQNIFYNFIKRYVYIDKTCRVINNKFGGIILYYFNVPQAIANGE
jgi:hypothetical protein